MIAVGMADEEDLCVAVFEAQLFDTVTDRGHIFREIGIDQDVALRCVDQVDGKIGRPT